MPFQPLTLGSPHRGDAVAESRYHFTALPNWGTVRGRASSLKAIKKLAHAYSKKHKMDTEVYEYWDRKDMLLGMYVDNKDGRGWVFSRV